MAKATSSQFRFTETEALSERRGEGIEGRVFVVTGGLSAVGAALCSELVERGAREVRAFDSRSTSPLLPSLLRKGVVCITGDIKKKNETDKALCGTDCVFHLAAYGLSGKEMLQARRIDEVNLMGTCNIVDSCVKCGVERLVFTSSYNVVFGGKKIMDGNESLGYLSEEMHFDTYGRCKALAEQLVLKSNGRPLQLKADSKLHTCAIRPAAVYGPHEEYFVPRILNLAEKGIFFCVIGGPEVKTDWVYVDNLVQAQLLASMALIDDLPGRQHAPACGQAYFISDGTPVNTFEFMQPLLEGLGYQLPCCRFNVNSAMIFAWIFWYSYRLIYPLLDKDWIPQPPFLPAEVLKVGITHYFSIMKARQQLGYVPHIVPKEGIQHTLNFWKMKKVNELRSPEIWYWIGCLGGMFLNFCCAFIPPPHMGMFECIRTFSLFVFRSQKAVQILFVIACILHLVEGLYAWQLAKKVDPKNSKGWLWQTLALGYPSLRLLLKRSRTRV